MPAMIRISNWVKDKSELDFMVQHLNGKGVECEIRKNVKGEFGVYRTYKPIGNKRPPEPFPDRDAWENKGER